MRVRKQEQLLRNEVFHYSQTGAVVSNVHGTSADSALFVEQGFTTTEGLKLDAAMSVSSKESTTFKVSVGFPAAKNRKYSLGVSKESKTSLLGNRWGGF